MSIGECEIHAGIEHRICFVNNDQSQTFGEWMRDTRKSLDMQQGDLAQATGFGQSYISKVERDEQPPSAEFCLELSKVVKLPVDYVLLKAGLTQEHEVNNAEQESPAARKIRALVGLLSPDDQTRAIELMETFVRTHRVVNKSGGATTRLRASGSKGNG
jgi:transcriptional regulator with XRE-family HTH domain